MSVAAGAVTVVATGGTTATLTSAAASGGTGPYTYQWYRSTTTGFSPGGGNLISGATALTLMDTGLLPNTTYYYVLRATDTGHSNDTADSTQATLTTTPPAQNQNQFTQAPTTGMIDQRYPYNTTPAQISTSVTALLPPGTVVKMVDTEVSSNQVFIVTPVTAITDDAIGVINYDMKTAYFSGGYMCELSQGGNVVYMIATAAIARGAKVQVDLLTGGGVKTATGVATNVIGWAFDKATAAGQQIRVKLLTPSFLYTAS